MSMGPSGQAILQQSEQLRLLSNRPVQSGRTDRIGSDRIGSVRSDRIGSDRIGSGPGPDISGPGT